jgi:nucleotide-binding universal stress UspA family protein
LVPTDFSRTAAEALRYAVPLARQLGGQITLLHVLDWPVVPAELGVALTDEVTLTRAAQAALDKLARATVPDELLAGAVVRTGRSYLEIARAAQTLKADFVVLATHGRTGVQRALLGSTAERVVRHAPCPVLTVRPKAGGKQPLLKTPSLAPLINRLLVPVDFSARSKAAVRFATDLARTMDARLALLHVVEPLPANFARHPAELAPYDAELKREARQQLDALAARVPKDLQVETLLRQDLPSQGIVEAARAWRSDLILLPTRGLTGLKYIVLGSTAEGVVRHAPCPVLTIGQG